MNNSLSRLRISIILLFFALLYLVVISRLFYWQIIKGGKLKQLGINQSSEILDIPAKRGDILLSDNYPLATTRKSYLLYANPKQLKENKDLYFKKISDILDIKKTSISAILSTDSYWARLPYNLDLNQKEEIEKLEIPGVGFQENDLRYYPESSMAAQLVGFLGKDKDGNDKGYFGIEGYYNDQLEGRSGRMYLIHDAFGIPVLNDIREEEKIDGRSLVLNIDRTVQYFVEKKLKEGVEKYQAEGGSMVVMDPNNGKIFAMASFPNFNPQSYYDFDYELYKNPVISGLYEPGSTFKPLIMSSAFDLKVVNSDTRCNICSGPVVISDYAVRTYNDQYYPNSTMGEVIEHSDNTGMVFVGKKLGLSNMLTYLKRFGIGENTQIDLQGEVSGDIREESNWYPIDLATASFGQGIVVTPIQLIVAVSAIANGGNIVKPYVVSKIITEEGKTIEIKPEIKRRILSEDTTKLITEMMVAVVERGESRWHKLDGYKVAAKTGTAQIPIQGHYDEKKTIGSFVGFFPADDPKIIMLVVLDRPKTNIFGANTAGPIFFSVAKELVNYYNIPPDN